MRHSRLATNVRPILKLEILIAFIARPFNYSRQIASLVFTLELENNSGDIITSHSLP